jgi:predicted phosphodiesterase
MNLLALADLHLEASKPVGRLGDYVADVDDKLKEIVDIADQFNVAAVLCAGDVFHRPAPTFSVLVRFQAFLERLNRRFISIPGSHDLFGNNLDTLYRTAIGFLSRVYDRFELLSEVTEKVTRVGTMSIGISGSGVLDIEMVHGLVLPIPDFGEYTLLQNYKTSAKIVLVGHYHDGYGLVTVDGVTFICPGSVVRTAAKVTEFTRRPRVAIISDNYEVEWKELTSAKLGEKVLSSPVVSHQVDFSDIASKWSGVIDSIEEVDVIALLKEVAESEGVSKEVLSYTLSYLEKSREEIAV